MTTTIDHPAIVEAALTPCPAWCNVDHAEMARSAAAKHHNLPETAGYHSGLLAEGVETSSHGPIYRAEVEVHPADGARLLLNVEVDSLTADQAEVLGRALLHGAEVLRSWARVSREQILASYVGRYGQWVTFEPRVFEQTEAERALHHDDASSSTEGPIAAARAFCEGLLRDYAGDDPGDRATRLTAGHVLRILDGR